MLPGNPDEGPLLGRQKPQPGPAGRARLISRDGVRTLQLAFREASPFPDDPGKGPGEKLTGPVY